VHESVDVAVGGIDTLAGVRVQVSPVAGETAEDTPTVPAKPLTEPIVIVEVPAVPALTVTAVGLAVIVKSATATVKATVADCDNEPLVPVTVTVKVPLAVGVQDRVELPDPVTLVGASVQLIPVAGDAVAARFTTPVKPLVAVIVIVDVPTWLTLTETLVGLAVMVKFCGAPTVTVTTTE
jgi:hypothetical protein